MTRMPDVGLAPLEKPTSTYSAPLTAIEYLLFDCIHSIHTTGVSNAIECHCTFARLHFQHSKAPQRCLKCTCNAISNTQQVQPTKCGRRKGRTRPRMCVCVRVGVCELQACTRVQAHCLCGTAFVIADTQESPRSPTNDSGSMVCN